MTRLNKSGALELLDGDDALYLRVVGIFLGDTPKQLGALKTALDSGDTPTALRCAHALKSAAATVGAEDLSGFCAQMERILGAGNVPDPALAEAIREEFAAVALLFSR